MWGRVRRADRRRPCALRGRTGDPGARQPGTPRRDGRGPRLRRRRRAAPPAARRVPPRGLRRAAAGSWGVRRRGPVPRIRSERERCEAISRLRGRGPPGPRLARRAARRGGDRPLARTDAEDPPVLRRLGRPRGAAPRASALRRCAASSRRDASPRATGETGARRLPLEPDARLQGDADRDPAARVLPRPRRRARRVDVLHVPRPVLDQRAASLGPRPAVADVAHNGEINTLRGNANWMRARESKWRSPVFGGDVAKLCGVLDADGSDSASSTTPWSCSPWPVAASSTPSS